MGRLHGTDIAITTTRRSVDAEEAEWAVQVGARPDETASYGASGATEVEALHGVIRDLYSDLHDYEEEAVRRAQGS